LLKISRLGRKGVDAQELGRRGREFSLHLTENFSSVNQAIGALGYAFSFVVKEYIHLWDVMGAELAGLEGGRPVVGEGELFEALDGVGVGRRYDKEHCGWTAE